MMKKIQILNNQNKISTEVASKLTCLNECDEFSIRIAFNEYERYQFKNKDVTLCPGNFLIINEGTVYNREINSKVPVSTLSIFFNNRFLDSFHHGFISSERVLLDEPFYAPADRDPEFLETLYPLKGDMMFNLLHIEKIFHLDESNDLLMNEYLYHCLFNFYRIYDREILLRSEQLEVANVHTRNELFRRLNNAKDFMISNYNKDIQLKDICNYACLSETHFYRSFKQAFHCSPHQFIMDFRLSQAKHMLKNTNHEIKVIVNTVGFDCVSSFTRLFKNRYGITPGNFRIATISQKPAQR
jgi:AraC family transcriptional regulator